MRNSFFLLLLIIILLFSLSCSSGSNSQGGSSGASAPALNAITISPTYGIVGRTITLDYNFTFSDPDGDLGGGRVYYQFGETSQNSVTLPDNLNDKKGNNSGQITLFLLNSQDPGTYNVSFWLVDRGGNRSNTLNTSFTVYCSGITRVVRCGSVGFQRNDCPIGYYPLSVVLQTQYSEAPCIKGQTWGFSLPSIHHGGYFTWVTQGCDADFSVCSQY